MSEARMPSVPVKIMFVDDEADVIEPLVQEAQDLGYETLFFEKGEDALAVLPDFAETLAIILCDYRMPDINGLEFRRKMLPNFQHIPFVVYSGFVTEDILRDAIDLKVSKFVDKPFEIDSLKDLILSEAKDRVEIIEEKTVLKNIFTDEAQELLEDLEENILLLEHDPHPERINTIFRLVHTIKGGSGVLDWPEFTKVVHSYEDLLSKLKNHEIKISPSIISILLKGFDFVSKSLASFIDNKRISIDVDQWHRVFNSIENNEETNSENDLKAQEIDSKDKEIIKVPLLILNEFMELSGEITVIRNSVKKLILSLQKEMQGHSDLTLLAEFIEEMHKINASMQNKITELRKVPLKNVFRSIPRTIRDLNNSLGKKIDFKTSGEDLRIDNNLATVLKNSLIHIVRNSADHGIELPNVRKDAGKPEKGTVLVEACEQGDEVIINISDDGAGIDPEKVLQRAIDKGLYTVDQARKLTVQQIYSIILEPGFSTSSSITDISGRGVGMDMVKNSVESIGGRIDIESQFGEGSRFVLKLPIPKSVTIIHSISVTIGDHSYSIPQDNIIRLIKSEINKLKKSIHELDGVQLFDVDDHLISLVDLKEDLCPHLIKENQNEHVELVILKSEYGNYGLLVDSINDSEEIVLKKLPRHSSNRLFKGATFMGDGSVGLILNIEGIAEHKGIANYDKNSQIDLEKQDEKSVSNLNSESQFHILFTLSREGLFSIPLDEVFRLEELPLEQFTSIRGKSTIIYRDQVMPLVEAETCLNRNTNQNDPSKFRATIVVNYQNHFYGILVKNILGIRSISGSMDKNIRSRPEVLGTYCLDDCIVTVLDIYKILGVTPPKDLNNQVKNVEQKNEPREPTMGWGMF